MSAHLGNEGPGTFCSNFQNACQYSLFAKGFGIMMTCAAYQSILEDMRKQKKMNKNKKSTYSISPLKLVP